MKEVEDPLVFAQANFYLGSAAVHCSSATVGKRYLKRSVDIIRRNNIRFVPAPADHEAVSKVAGPNSLLVEPLELVEERVTLLTQMVGIEIFIYLLGQPSAVLTGFELPQEEKPEYPVRLCIMITNFCSTLNHRDCTWTYFRRTMGLCIRMSI